MDMKNFVDYFKYYTVLYNKHFTVLQDKTDNNVDDAVNLFIIYSVRDTMNAFMLL